MGIFGKQKQQGGISRTGPATGLDQLTPQEMQGMRGGGQEQALPPGPQQQPDPYAGQRFDAAAPGQGMMTEQPTGWDMSSPGVGEQFFNQQQQGYTQPGQMQNFYAQQQAGMNQPGAMERYQQGSNLSGPTASEQTMEDPGLGQYYENAGTRASGQLNTQLAGRGAYGSSQGLNMLSQQQSDLNAQQANREGDYRLRQAGQSDSMRLQQAGLAGQQAAQAQGMQQSRLGQMGQFAGAADAARLQGLNSGMGAASQAQGLRRQRGRDYMGDVFSPAQLGMAAQGQGMNQLLGNDQASMESALAMALGLTGENLNQDYRNKAAHREDIGMGLDIFGKFFGM